MYLEGFHNLGSPISKCTLIFDLTRDLYIYNAYTSLFCLIGVLISVVFFFYQCTGRYCQPGMENLTQNFEVVSSVAFIDASEPAAPSLAEKPQFTAKLPRDFFHPFYSSSSESITQRRRLVLAFSGVALIITTLSTRPR